MAARNPQRTVQVAAKPANATERTAAAVASSQPRGLPKLPGMLRIRAVRGRGLLNRETLGCSDPYVKFYDPQGRLVSETDAISSTQQPDWPNDARSKTAFRVYSPKGDIVIQLWDKNRLSDQPLGEITIPVLEAAGYRGEVNHQVHPRKDETDEMILNHRNNLGTLTLEFSYEPQPLTSLEKREPDPSLPSSLPALLHIRVMAGIGLKNREATGTSDPYVKVMAPDGSRLIKTSAMPSTLNPVWSGSNTMASLRVRASSSGTVTFQVWDKNTVSDEFMGEVQVEVQEAISFATERTRKIPLILRPRDPEEDAFIIENAKALGCLTVEFSLEPETLQTKPSEPPGTFTITVESAKGLIDRRIVGQSQPYVRFVSSDGETIFETPPAEVDVRKIIEWKQAEATLNWRAYDLEHSLTLQVWDNSTVRDNFLGEVRLTTMELLNLATEAESALALRPRRKESDAIIKKHQDGLGTVFCQIRFTNESHFRLTQKMPELTDIQLPPGLLVAHVKGCKHLAPRSERLAVYLKVIDARGNVAFGEKESRPFQNSTDPNWEEDNGSAHIRLANQKGLLTFQVWDKRILSDDFLGEVTLPVRDALDYAQYPEAKFMIRPREREKDKFILENQNQLGVMTISFTFLPDQTPFPDVDSPGSINGVFSVSVVGCKALSNFEATGVSDPYVKVLGADDDLLFQTEPRENTLEPTWDARNTCDVPVRSNVGYIKFQVWDHNAILDDLMGEARLTIEEAWVYATLARNRAIEPKDRTISVPLRVPLTTKANRDKITQHEHELGVVQILIEFTPGDEKKSAAELEKVKLFTMSIPLDFVIDHIEKSNESAQLSAELLLYIPFLIMFIFFALARRSTLEEHYIASGYGRQFTTRELPPVLFNHVGDNTGVNYELNFFTMKEKKHYYDWLEGVVAPQFWDWRNPNANSVVFGPFGINEALGAIRVRAYQMSPTSCSLNDAFVPANDTTGSFRPACYSDFDITKTDHTPIVLPSVNKTINYVDGCNYVWVDILGDLNSYPCGGHTLDLPFANTTFTDTLNQLRALRDIDFMNETKTRFIVVEWFSYNVGLDIFTAVKYFQEITGGGGWAPTAQIRSFRVHRDGSTAFYFVYDCFFTLFVTYYWYKFFRDWVRFYRRTGLVLAHLLTVWTLLELLNLAIFVTALVFHFLWYKACFDFTDSIPTMDMNQYPQQLDYIMNLFYSEMLCNAANSVLSFLKILTFLKMNAKLSLLTRTMGRAADNILGVLFIFTLIVIAYALAGNQLYGIQLFEYRNLSSAMSALFRALMGKFDYNEMRYVSRPTTFFYFWSFIILGLFVMLNFCTAIIGSAYQTEQDAEKTLPLAVQLRRLAREIKALSIGRVITAFINAFIKRTRRLPDDIIFEHLYQYRSSIYQLQGVNEAAVRAGEESRPELLITHKQFVEVIPKKDIEYITQPTIDHKYLVIAEDFVVLHHDEEKAKEDHLAETFTRAIRSGFRKVLVDRFDEVKAVQRTLLEGQERVVSVSSKSAIGLSGQSHIDSATAAVLSRPVLTGPAETTQAVDAKQLTELKASFDADAASEKLLQTARQIVEAREGTGKKRRVKEVSDEVKAEQQRVAKWYMADRLGPGIAGHGLRQALIEAETLQRVSQRLLDVTCVRAHAYLDDIDEAHLLEGEQPTSGEVTSRLHTSK